MYFYLLHDYTVILLISLRSISQRLTSLHVFITALNTQYIMWGTSIIISVFITALNMQEISLREAVLYRAM